MRMDSKAVPVAGTFGPGPGMTCYLERFAGEWWIRVEEGRRVARVGSWRDAEGAVEAAQAVVFARHGGGGSFKEVVAWARDTLVE